jgi:hypothetical protein
MTIRFAKAVVLGAIIAAPAAMSIMFAPGASADMCSPMNGPGGFLYPQIKACQLYVPGAGSLAPNIPVLTGPQTAPYPHYEVPWGSYIPRPGWFPRF